MPKNEKIQYEVDPFNRLILSKTSRASRAPKFRHILDGKFKIGKNNTLTYQVKSPPPPAIPQQLKLSGDWSLDKEHNLVFTLDKENNQQAKDKISLKGEIIDVKSDRLEFAVSAKDTASRMHFYILRLQGRWQADKYNRLSFLAEKEDGLYDILTLTGMWEINKEKLTRTLSFKGFWDVAKKSGKYHYLFIS